jgi:hypothetical protein
MREPDPDPQRHVHERQHRETDQQREDGHAEILLGHDQSDGERHDQPGHHEIAHAADRRGRIAAEVMGQRDRHADLRDLRRLEPPRKEPGPRAARLVGDRQGEQQECDRDAVDQVGEAIVMAVVDQHDDRDYERAQSRHGRLTADDIRATLDPRGGGRDEIDESHRDQCRHDAREHPIPMLDTTSLDAQRAHRPVPPAPSPSSRRSAIWVGTRRSFFSK